MYFKKCLLSSLLSFGVLQAQSSVGLNINDTDLEVISSIDLNTFTEYSDGTSYLLDSYYINSDGDNLFAIGLTAENTLQGVAGLTLGFGARLVFLDEFTALPLFGRAVYTLPLNDSIPTICVGASFAYSPAVLTFSDGESYSEFRMEAEMEVIQNIHLFVGYRNIETEYKTHTQTFNESFYAGMKMSF